MEKKDMAAVLVDYENVHGSNGLKGVEALKEDDTLIIFFSESCSKIKREYMEFINDSKCKFQIMKLKNIGKNALDFYISTECGALYAQGEKQLAIISNDKGFQAVLDYFSVNENASDVRIVKAGTVESALMQLDSPENLDRRELLKKKACMLDITEEYARIEERNLMKTRLKEVVSGTEYEDKISEIIDLIEMKKELGNKSLYTSSLHSFGKSAGTEIYKLVKRIV